MDKPCNKPDQIRNPNPPHRCIKIGGVTWKKLVKDGVIKDIPVQSESSSGGSRPVQSESSSGGSRPCPSTDQIRNPNPPHRCIKIGGVTWKKLVKDGVIQKELQQIIKKCPTGKVVNPNPPHRCIKIGGKTYYNLVKKGLITVSEDHYKYLNNKDIPIPPNNDGENNIPQKSPSPKPKPSGKDEKSPSPKPKPSGDNILNTDIESVLLNIEPTARDVTQEQNSILRCLGLLAV